MCPCLSCFSSHKRGPGSFQNWWEAMRWPHSGAMAEWQSSLLGCYAYLSSGIFLYWWRCTWCRGSGRTGNSQKGGKIWDCGGHMTFSAGCSGDLRCLKWVSQPVLPGFGSEILRKACRVYRWRERDCLFIPMFVCFDAAFECYLAPWQLAGSWLHVLIDRTLFNFFSF